MNNTIYGIDLTRALPPTLKNDEDMLALARVIGAELQETGRLIRQNIIYPRIDELPENVLDILAYDLHVDWYDDSYSIPIKKQTIKDSVKIHRRMGTKYAVETALGTVLPGTTIEEWFEYGGTPYCFRISLPISGEVTLERQRRILSKVWYYKNLRSHLEAFQLELETAGNVRVGAYTMASETVEIWPSPAIGLEVGGMERTAAYTQQAQTLEIYPG